MKYSICSAALLAPMLLAIALPMAGSAAFGQAQTSGMVATLQSVQDAYTQAQLQTKITKDALNELIISADIDLQQAYDAFSESANMMQERGGTLVMHADAMHFRGASYLVEPGKTGTVSVYPRLRKPEDKSASEPGEYFDAISEKGWEVKRAFRAYQFDLSEIQACLSSTLTPLGMEVIVPMIRKAKVDSDSLHNSLEQALAAIEHAKTAKDQAAPKVD